MLVGTPSAFAIQEQVLSLQKGEVNATWDAYNNLGVEAQDDGVLITAKETGVFLADVAIKQSAQTAVITTSSNTNQTLMFVWVHGSVETGQWYRIKLSVPAGKQVTSTVALHMHKEWTNDATLIGIEAPADSAFTLHSISLVHASLLEQLYESVLSFWTFDAYQPYSINFGWGPQVALTEIERLTMFDSLPPRALSGTLIVYQFVLAAIALLLIVGFTRFSRWTRPRFLVSGMLCVLCVAWLGMDIRMGSEFLSWIHKDSTEYIFAPAQSRTFRDRNRFYDFAAFAAPLVADRKHYVFFAEVPWPYLGNIGYLTYPALPSDKIDRDDTWVVYRRSDIKQNEAGELVSNGEIVSAPGKILGRFDDSSFVFRLHSPPPAL